MNVSVFLDAMKAGIAGAAAGIAAVGVLSFIAPAVATTVTVAGAAVVCSVGLGGYTFMQSVEHEG